MSRGGYRGVPRLKTDELRRPSGARHDDAVATLGMVAVLFDARGRVRGVFLMPCADNGIVQASEDVSYLDEPERKRGRPRKPKISAPIFGPIRRRGRPPKAR